MIEIKDIFPQQNEISMSMLCKFNDISGI